MANGYKGCCVSIKCLDSSIFQGEVSGISDDNNILTLKRPIKNGIPQTEKEIQIKYIDVITDLIRLGSNTYNCFN